MSKKTIIIFKPRYMKMSVRKKKNKLIYDWKNQSLDLDYVDCQKKLNKLVTLCDFNLNYYLSFVSLSKKKYYKTMKTGNSDPITNFKIRLIYLQMMEDFEHIRIQYILTYYILKTNLVTANEYAKSANIQMDTLIGLIKNKNQKYNLDTFKKIKVTNLKIQKEILTNLKKTDIKRYNKLKKLGIIEFFHYYKPKK